MIESYSITDNNKSKSPYSYLHLCCCPKCACTDESMIVYDDDLVEEITTFGKNMFHEKHYTMLPHKCLACGEFYVVADINELPNKDFTKAFIAVIMATIIQVVLFTIGIIRFVENNSNSGWMIGAICFILVTIGSAYGLSESMVRYKDDVGLDKLVEDTLNKRYVQPLSSWERFDANNHKIKNVSLLNITPNNRDHSYLGYFLIFFQKPLDFFREMCYTIFSGYSPHKVKRRD